MMLSIESFRPIVGFLANTLYSWQGAWSWWPFPEFFHLLLVVLVPGMLLAAPVAFGLQAMWARRAPLPDRRIRFAVTGALVYLGLTGVGNVLIYLGTPDMGGVAEVPLTILAALIVVFPVHALSVVGFWIPVLLTYLYTSRVEEPRWWAASLIGTFALLVGVALYFVLGILVGAPTD